MAKKIVETPLMKQYLAMKAKHPDAVLLFRVGDFYETFSDDAIVASEILGITLTRRANGAATHVELAGFPHHALDTYLPRLVRAGKRVAICEQLEDPKLTKKLVKRGITELVTPGVVLNDNVLTGRENNFLGALHVNGAQRGVWGVAFLDISTGEFLTARGPVEYIDKLLATYGPKEVLIERGCKRRAEETLTAKFLTFELDDWVFTTEAANERLLKQFGTTSLKGFGIDGMDEAVIAAGACLHYLDVTNHTETRHITALTPIEADARVRLDRFTVRNLELTQPLNPDGKSLLSVIDRTVTPMGARTMLRWIQAPLRDPAAINDRLDVVDFFFRHPEVRQTVMTQMQLMGDLERLTGKVSNLRVTPREVQAIRQALTAMEPVKLQLTASDNEPLAARGRAMETLPELAQRIGRWLQGDPSNKVGSGQVIADGVSDELDELRAIAGSGRDYLRGIQQRESEATGIPSLKVGFNNVFGYYIEVTNTHRDKVPPEWIRKQTLVNAERYITPELKDYESKILSAEDRIASLETSLFNDLVAYIARFIPALQADAHILAVLDCLLSFTRVAEENKYVRPIVDDGNVIELTNARHPVIERQLPPGEPYIANTVRLCNDDTQIMMITGPNMSGKSALLRQTALNVLMAQIGCFIAADAGRIGYVDKIFTRVGASDNISLGESTFMVEMNEAAAIINNLSERSLVLFDELGRGTSTYDGISIAWAIVEHIHNCPAHPKTLFATHYHELNEMERSYARIVNYHVSVREIDGRVVFVRKLERGGSEHSFGIHVARLAGMPEAIVRRADSVLHQLEGAQTGPKVGQGDSDGNDTANSGAGVPAGAPRGADTPNAGAIQPQTECADGVQLSFFQLDDPVLGQVRDEIIGLDINSLTPIEALNKLHDIRTIITGKA